MFYTLNRVAGLTPYDKNARKIVYFGARICMWLITNWYIPHNKSIYKWGR